MPESSRNKATARAGRGRGATAGRVPAGDDKPGLSIVRTVLSALLVLAGIAWMVVYLTVGQERESLAWMADLGRWNFLIGFLAIFLGLTIAAHPSSPLGRGRGVVVGMLACFLIGLIWIVIYYMTGNYDIPLIADLAQYNLLVGIGFMAVGFVYATHWE